MSAFFVATVSVKDGAKFQDYAGKAMETFRKFNGEILIRGKSAGALAGISDHQAIGIVKFPDMETLNQWYRSDAYQELVPLRDEAADMTLVKYEQPA